MKPTSAIEDSTTPPPDEGDQPARGASGPPPPFIADLVFTLGMSLGTLVTCLAGVGAVAVFTRDPAFGGLFAAVAIGLGGLGFVFSRAEDGRRWAVWIVAALAYLFGGLLGLLVLVLWARIFLAQQAMSCLGVVSVFLFAIAAGAVYFARELLAWETRLRRFRHNQVVECPQCGYDLRGNPDAPACPECGAARLVAAPPFDLTLPDSPQDRNSEARPPV